MSGRDDILNRIRSASGRPAPEPGEARAAYAEAVGGHAPRPEWQQTRRARFLERLEGAAATWEPVADLSALPEAVAGYMARHELPKAIHVAPHPDLETLTWPDDWVAQRDTAGLDQSRVTLTVARFGIAETGTLMLPGGPAAPPSMNLLAEHHLVLLRADRLVDYQEEAWSAYRAETGTLPRAVMMITGPSRTADIEQTLQLGAHGPRKLHLFLLGSAT